MKYLRLLIIIVVAFSVYANTLTNDFVWDGVEQVKNNLLIRNWENLSKIFTLDFYGMYRPLKLFTFFLDYWLWGLNPYGFHLTSILLHAVCSILVYLFILLLVKDKVLSWLAALIFVVHPIHTESVSWISARDDVLMSIFYLSTLILVFKYLKIKNSTFHYRFFFASAAASCYLGALLSKEMAVSLPILIFAGGYLYQPKNDKSKQQKIYQAAFLFSVISAGYMIFRCLFLSIVVQAQTFAGVENYLKIVLTGPLIFIGYYLSLLIFPLNLCLDYSFPDISFAQIIFYNAILIVMIYLSVKWRKKSPLISGGFLMIVITIVPAMNIIPKAQLIAERYLYLPSVGLSLIIAGIFLKLRGADKNALLAKRSFKTVIYFIYVVMLIFYSYQTFIRNTHWRTQAILFAETVSSPLASTRAHFNLAEQFQKNCVYDEAIMLYQVVIDVLTEKQASNYGLFDFGVRDLKKIKRYSRIGDALLGQAACYKEKGQINKAIAVLNKAIKLDPHYYLAYNDLGIIYYDQDKIDNALEIFFITKAISPRYPSVYYNIGLCFLKKEKFNQARRNFEKAIILNPDYEKPKNQLRVLGRRVK